MNVESNCSAPPEQTEVKDNDMAVNPRFWTAFGLAGAPDVQGKRVLDIGCGHGSRCLELAGLGAEYVVGLDIDQNVIAMAKERYKDIPADLSSKVSFHLGPLDTLTEGNFDVVVSEDSFEHIMNVSEVLEQINSKLSSDGQVYLGFGPLYYSPLGDHGWIRQVLPFRRYFSWPWGHLLFSRKYVLRKLSELLGREVNYDDLWPYQTLNRHTAREFRMMFEQSSLRIASWSANPGYSWKGKLLHNLAKLPFGEKYFVWGIYAILEADSE